MAFFFIGRAVSLVEDTPGLGSLGAALAAQDGGVDEPREPGSPQGRVRSRADHDTPEQQGQQTHRVPNGALP